MDIDDLYYSAIYSLGLTMLDIIDQDVAYSIERSIFNKDFEVFNK